jgi:hypothetical protein
MNTTQCNCNQYALAPGATEHKPSGSFTKQGHHLLFIITNKKCFDVVANELAILYSVEVTPLSQ